MKKLRLMAALAIATIAAVAATSVLAIPKETAITAKYSKHAPPAHLATAAFELNYTALERLDTAIDTTAPPEATTTVTAERQDASFDISHSIIDINFDAGARYGPTIDFALAITGAGPALGTAGSS